MTSTGVRRAAEGDTSGVQRVLLDAFRVFEPQYTPAAFAVTTPDSTAIRARISEGPTWVATHQGQIVGTVSAVLGQSGTYIRSMAVLPSAQGQGMGRALLEAVEQFARQNGSPRLYLSTTPFLHDAIRLYEANGYTRTNEPPFDLHGTPLFTMEKRLSPRT